ncbi:BPSL0067 family protein [Mesorhizobium sophorae]|uniref:BPSL0067 family protein n=1 Tax=Mesorhizobium sophorae TaxID=1300294 RepID=UPI00117D07F4|nr:BPSL0067 family protein [Mesorhizobium sophorae]
MSYVAPDTDAYMGEVVGDGQCVAYVKAAASCPATSQWAEGSKVRDSGIATGTAIATFQDGKYNNYTDGRSHAAIFISQDGDGLVVHDQWLGQAVHERTIRFKGGSGKPVNDGDAFSVIENAAALRAIAKFRRRQAGTKQNVKKRSTR